MKRVARFEILNEIIAGVFVTYTARDPKNGETVLLHYMPPGVSGPPAEQLRMLVPGCPGNILESGIDESTQRAFVITEYPRNRKQLFLWIKKLTSLSTDAGPTPAPASAEPDSAPAAGAVTRMFEPSAIFGAPLQVAAGGQTSLPVPETVVTAPAPPPVAENPPAPTRLFDPSAVFGGVPEIAVTVPTPPPIPESPPAPTRLFDPSGIFGGVPDTAVVVPTAPPIPESPPAPTRLFDPSAVYDGVPETAVTASIPEPVAEGSARGTRLFDPSAIFGDASQVATPSPTSATKPESPPGDPRLYDLSAIFGGATPAATPEHGVPANPTAVSQETASDGSTRTFLATVPQPAESGAAGATRIFDPAAIFGAVAGPGPSPGPAAHEPPQRTSQPVAPPPAVRGPTRVIPSVAVAQMLAATSRARVDPHPSAVPPESAESVSAPPAKAQVPQPLLPYIRSAEKPMWRGPVVFVVGFVVLAILIVLFFLSGK